MDFAPRPIYDQNVGGYMYRRRVRMAGNDPLLTELGKNPCAEIALASWEVCKLRPLPKRFPRKLKKRLKKEYARKLAAGQIYTVTFTYRKKP